MDFVAVTGNGKHSKGDKDEEIFYFWSTQLTNLTMEQRIALGVTVVIVAGLAIIGNAATIVCNVQRKQRVFFCTCLVSLAISDILYPSFTATYYLAAFWAAYASLWTIGDTMCRLVPFAQNAAILANSFSLVAIAADRYIAVRRLVPQQWEAGKIACLSTALLIWGLALGVASPVLMNYHTIKAIIFIPDPTNSSGPPIDWFETHLCVGDKHTNRVYYEIVFCFIFLPAFLAFLFLNGIIAKEIWRRRKPIEERNRGEESGGTASTEFTSGKRTSDANWTSVPGNYRKIFFIGRDKPPLQSVSSKCTSSKIHSNSAASSHEIKQESSRTQRKKRHIKMFRVLLVIVSVFFVCRLPNWTYLLVKLYLILNEPVYWVLHYSLGILILFNCAINPLLYTFLDDAIKFTEMVQKAGRWLCTPCRKCTFRGNVEPLESSESSGENFGGVYMGGDPANKK